MLWEFETAYFDYIVQPYECIIWGGGGALNTDVQEVALPAVVHLHRMVVPLNI